MYQVLQLHYARHYKSCNNNNFYNIVENNSKYHNIYKQIFNFLMLMYLCTYDQSRLQ